mmetsp:Transcript_40543/g.107151  ORF Transcript_40543/g.107151 Transcript_40543/m.107151 type:complete len:260 (-) Transcript_40543:504-1283(-)
MLLWRSATWFVNSLKCTSLSEACLRPRNPAWTTSCKCACRSWIESTWRLNSEKDLLVSASSRASASRPRTAPYNLCIFSATPLMPTLMSSALSSASTSLPASSLCFKVKHSMPSGNPRKLLTALRPSSATSSLAEISCCCARITSIASVKVFLKLSSFTMEDPTSPKLCKWASKTSTCLCKLLNCLSNSRSLAVPSQPYSVACGLGGKRVENPPKSSLPLNTNILGGGASVWGPKDENKSRNSVPICVVRKLSTSACAY